MKWKTIISPKSVLLVLLLAAAVMAVPVSATITPIFSIPGNTSVVFPSEGISPYSTVDYGPLNIPNSFLNSESTSTQSLSLVTTSPYNLVTFTNPISVRSDTVNLPITLYGQSYTAILTKSDINSGIDGMDGYIGTIMGLNNSRIVLVIVNGNTVTGSIQLDDDYLVISPAQNRFYTDNTEYPLHIVYSENDLLLSDEPMNFCGTKDVENQANYPSGQQFDLAALQSRSVSALPLDITFVTDSQYYGSAGNWESKAYSLLLDADEYFIANQNLNIILRAEGYDSSKRTDLSSNQYRITDPLLAAKQTFPTSYINGKHSDIFVYLGGYDQSYPAAVLDGDKNKVGESDFPPNGRIAWVQMVADTQGHNYDASTYAITHCFIHELGHIFNAQHDDSSRVTYNGVTKFNVMKSMYSSQSADGLSFATTAINEMLPYRATVVSYW
ncbi:MAG: M12 family metallo-peptidase [Methanocorpusculum sp.]|nr:M12 family metallo-peptidase [Methanocorpusculum sp.]